jgi:hypothetical protein
MSLCTSIRRPRGFRTSCALATALLAAGLLVAAGEVAVAPIAGAMPNGQVDNNEENLASAARQMFDALQQNGGRLVRPTSGAGALNTSGVTSQANRQVNDPLLDNVQSYPGAAPFVFAIESETSLVSVGSDLVAGYNSSAGTRTTDAAGDVSQLLFSAYSVSHDGGQTWRSGFVPPLPGSSFTFGDPSLAVDRSGTVYYASLTSSAGFKFFGIQINKSTDHGDTWSPGTLVVKDNGADKEWMAIGPDPADPARDNIYITWTSYTRSGSELWLAKSSDGGASWSTKRLFAPNATRIMSSYIQFSNPVVDQSTGRLYVPFLHFSNTDADYVKVLASSDGGKTFSFLNFDVPGAPERTGFPNVTPGALSDCGQFGGPRLVLHQGPSTTGGAFGLPRWMQSTRIITQPTAAAANGRLFIALNTSTSPLYGAGTGSSIRLLYSPDGGASWATPLTVSPSTSSDVQHVHPALTADRTGSRITIAYYVQGSDERLRVDETPGTVVGDHVTLGAESHLSSSSFDLTPSNVTVTPTLTLNFDSEVVPCYSIGEYMSLAQTPAGPAGAWGDNRENWKEPAGALVSGVHAQPDVFFDYTG